MKSVKIVKLTIIIASLDSQTALKSCLDSVLANRQNDIEIIVADCCLKEKSGEWIEKYPTVSFIEFAAKTSLPVLLGAGIARAHGEIVAVTDSSCVVAQDWVSSILKAHRAESPVIGGAVEMLEDGNSSTDWAAYFCDYGQFAPPAPRGIVDAVPGNNFSVKRQVLKRGTEFVGNEFWKTHWCRHLQSLGIRLISEPTILVNRRKTDKLIPFLFRRFYQGRCFAGMRVAKETIFKRLFYALCTIFLPMVFFYRTLAPLIGKKRFFGKLLTALPVIAAAISFWSVGEAVGYIAGAGNACKRID